MKHCVLFKLTPGTDPVEIQEKLWKTYRKLDDALDWLNHPVVFRGCRDGADCYDLMVTVDIDEEERLDEYLSHPLTLKLEGKIEDVVESKVVFDHY